MGYLSCDTISTCDPFKNRSKSNMTNFSFEHLHSATKGFSQTNFLGKGSHGSVYKALLHRGDLIAAVKRTTTHHSLQCMPTPADNEIETLSRIRSPRLVNLLGFGADPVDGRKLIVVEYMPNGSLYDLLHSTNTKPPPGLAKRVKIALQVAKAVQHLHTSNPPVIHRDIKSSNVLFDGKWKARLGDFGLALRGHVNVPPAGTLGYLDPCYLAPSDLSVKSDVFSFGILLLEIFSGRNAIDLKYSPPWIVDWAVPLITSGKYEQIFDPTIEIFSDNSIRQLAVLAMRCVKSTAEKRPEMTEVVQCLIAVSKSLVWNRRRRTTPSLIETVKATSSSKKVTNGSNDACHVARSKSIGSLHDIVPLDLSMVRRKGGPAVAMMNRSKSTRELLVQKRNGGNGIVFRNPNVRESESSKLLLVKFS